MQNTRIQLSGGILLLTAEEGGCDNTIIVRHEGDRICGFVNAVRFSALASEVSEVYTFCSRKDAVSPPQATPKVFEFYFEDGHNGTINQPGERIEVSGEGVLTVRDESGAAPSTIRDDGDDVVASVGRLGIAVARHALEKVVVRRRSDAAMTHDTVLPLEDVVHPAPETALPSVTSAYAIVDGLQREISSGGAIEVDSKSEVVLGAEAGKNTRSLTFLLNNKVINIESGAPFHMGGDNTPVPLISGTNTVQVIPHADISGTGKKGKPFEFFVEQTAISAPVDPNALAIDSVMYVDLRTTPVSREVSRFGSVVAHDKFSVVATSTNAASVSFHVDGKLFHVENVAPWAMSPNDQEILTPAILAPGKHNIAIVAHSEANGKGRAGEFFEFEMLVPGEATGVGHLQLIDVDTQKVVAGPFDGNLPVNLQLDQLPPNCDMEAVVHGPVDAVRFAWGEKSDITDQSPFRFPVIRAGKAVI